MGSRKRSAQAARKAKFESQLGDQLGGVFAREDARRAERDARHEEHLRHQACERKNRYDTQWDAESAIEGCYRHGARNLHTYRCPYCNGWHLTHKAKQ